MTGQSCNLLHRRVFPHVYLVLAIAVCGDQLVDVLGEHEVADLAASLDRLQVLQFNRIPELDGAVLGSTSSGQQSLLVWRPRDCLDSSLVLVESGEWLRTISGAPEE